MHHNYLDAASSIFPKVTIGGRLGAYQYYDMDQVIAMAMKDARGFA
jgi:UDP-galactopyranose mutase